MENKVYLLFMDSLAYTTWEIYSQNTHIIGTYTSMESAMNAAEQIAAESKSCGFTMPLQWKTADIAGVNGKTAEVVIKEGGIFYASNALKICELNVTR